MISRKKLRKARQEIAAKKGDFALLGLFMRADSPGTFSRIVTLKPNDPAVTAVVSAFSIDDGEVRVQRSNLFGLDMEDAIIMRAKKAA